MVITIQIGFELTGLRIDSYVYVGQTLFEKRIRIVEVAQVNATHREIF